VWRPKLRRIALASAFEPSMMNKRLHHSAELTTSLEKLVDGKVALENKVTAILDLADGIEA
jgi:hypothetical protein